MARANTGLSYRTLKSLARNALIYSFLPDAEKQQELARFDRLSVEFEASIVREQPWLQRLWWLAVEAVAAGTIAPAVRTHSRGATVTMT